MKDPHDQGTPDLLPLPKTRGRPKTGNALSNAEKQRAYRQRLKAKKQQRAEYLEQFQDSFVVRLSPHELVNIVYALDYYTKSLKIFGPERLPIHNELRERLRSIYQKKRPDDSGPERAKTDPFED